MVVERILRGQNPCRATYNLVQLAYTSRFGHAFKHSITETDLARTELQRQMKNIRHPKKDMFSV